MMRRIAAISFVFALISCVFVIPSGAEEEPNDSMDDPNMLDDEWITGHVSHHYYNEDGQPDMDFYRIDTPMNGVIIVTLKKLDTDL